MSFLPCTHDAIFNNNNNSSGGGGGGDDDGNGDDSDVASHTPWRSHTASLCLAPASRAAPYGASAIIGELRCLFGGASADQSRLAARSSPILAFISLLAAALSRTVPRLRAPPPRPTRHDFKATFTPVARGAVNNE
ncbi:hypothetical protein P5V15_010381 [Pogonomyrmex californicus]